MAHHGSEEVEDVIRKIVTNNPHLSTTGIMNRLKSYGIKLSHDATLKFINRMIQLDGLRAERSQTGAITYFFPKEA